MITREQPRWWAGMRRGAWVGALSGAVLCLVLLHVWVVLWAVLWTVNFRGVTLQFLAQIHGGTPIAWWIGGGLGALTGAAAGGIGFVTQSRRQAASAGALVGFLIWITFVVVLFMVVDRGKVPPIWHPLFLACGIPGIPPGIIAGLAGAAVKSN